jgi:hypothetical protein
MGLTVASSFGPLVRMCLTDSLLNTHLLIALYLGPLGIAVGGLAWKGHDAD